MTRHDTRAFVERTDALSGLTALFERAVAGEPGVAVVEGVAGRGKTTLMARAVASARRRGMRVAEAAGLAVEVDLPFALAARALKPLVRRVGSQQLFAGSAQPARVVIEEGSAPVATPALTVAFALVVDRLSERGPLLLALDDVQWSDAATVALVRYIGARLGDQPLALLLAQRTSDHSTRPGAHDLAALRTLSGVTTVELAPLSVDGVARVLQAEIGAVSGAAARAVHEITGGNPFFVWEVIAELRASGVDVESMADRAVRSQLVLSATLPTAQRRLTHAAQQAQALARASAVLGGEFTLDQAALVADIDPDVARGSARELVDAALFDPSGSRFAHALVERAVLASTPAPERARLHQRAARVLHDAGVRPVVVATHLLRAPAAPSCETARTLLAASRSARLAGDGPAALRFAERALAELPDGEDARPVHEEIALAAARACNPRWREASDRAMSDDRAAGARLLLQVGRALFGASALREAADAFHRGMQTAAEGSDEHLLLFGRYVHAVRVQVERPDDRTDLVDDLEAAVERFGDRTSPAWREAAACLSYQLAITGATAARVHEVASAALDPVLVTDREIRDTVTYFTAVLAATIVGSDADIGALERALELSERLELPVLRQIALTYRGTRLLREGHVTDAIHDLDEALQIGPLAPVLQPKIATERALMHYEQGAFAEAMAALDGCDPGTDSTGFFNGALRARGVIRAARGDTVGAMADLRECGRREAMVLVEGAIAIPWAFDLALVAAGTDQALLVAPVLATARRDAERQGAPFRIAHGARAAAALAPEAERDALLEHAVAAVESTPWCLELLESKLALGIHLVRTRREDRGGQLLRETADAAHRRGALRISQQAVAALRDAGYRPRRIAVRGFAALTPTERDVIKMAATGATNSEIASAQRLGQGGRASADERLPQARNHVPA